jgi:hypothetical protein
MSGSIDVAYLLALLQFASTFLVAVVYSVPAKKLIDPVANRIASELIGIGEDARSVARLTMMPSQERGTA